MTWATRMRETIGRRIGTSTSRVRMAVIFIGESRALLPLDSASSARACQGRAAGSGEAAVIG